MRVIIAGSRSITDLRAVFHAMARAREYGIVPTSILCGMARGVDMLGYEWARLQEIHVDEYPADWSKGRTAGFVRNFQMARNADALVLVWDGKSNGSANMLSHAERLKLKIYKSMYRRPVKE